MLRHLAFMVFALVPLTLLGQLDRIRTDMSEAEFIKSFPEAKRDLDREAVWVSTPGSNEGVEGNQLWRIYNDTVSAYRFVSVKAQGPSANYPKADSTTVHRMRMSVIQVRGEFEIAFGKPSQVISRDFTEVGKEGIDAPAVAYLATWNFGSAKYITIRLSTDLSTGNFINAPGKFTVVESQSYELNVEVTYRSEHTQIIYGLGEEDIVFFDKHPDCAAQVKLHRNHIYVIQDTLTSENAHWQFTFASGILSAFYYRAYAGTAYLAPSDEAAYYIMKSKTDKLFKEGSIAFGKQDTLSNTMATKYVASNLKMAYNNYHLHCTWTTKQGHVFMNFQEIGGGKNPDITFKLEVFFALGQ